MKLFGRRLSRRTAISLGVLVLLVAGGVFGSRWRVPWIINSLLRDWAAGTIDRESGGVYQLEFGRARFNWALRRVTVDSISLTTLRAANDRRPQRLPGLRVMLKACTISGVHALTLIRRAGLVAGTFGCRSGALTVDVPGADAGDRSPAPDSAEGGERQAFLVFSRASRCRRMRPAYGSRGCCFPGWRSTFACRGPLARAPGSNSSDSSGP